MESEKPKPTGKKGKKKKIIIIAVVVLLAFVLFIPLSNLIFVPKRPALSAQKMQDPHFQLAGAVFQEKCLDCHTSKTAKPWYASLPIAKSMINQDIEAGIMALDMSDGLFSERVFRPVALAKIESTMYLGSMPPARYTLMHWNASLSEKEKNDVLNWIKQVRITHYAAPDVAATFAGEPIQPLPLKVAVDEKKAALGNKLYHDTRLSGDNTISCASCHGLDEGGCDQDKCATGIKGQLGPINTPTVYNARYNVVQFWDGRAKDLKDQAGGPVTNPIEMGGDWKNVIPKLQADPEYKQAFEQLYAGNMTEENIRDAIATFEETLITPNSRFDQYLRGESDALTDEELKGYDAFVKVGCTSCHLGPAVGGTHFEKMGREKDYFQDRGNLTEADYGRFNVTKKESDRYKFKVPILRNVEVTYPYFHDARTKDLKEAIELMGTYQLGRKLSAEQTQALEKFLLTLTGEYNGKSLHPPKSAT